MFLAYLSIDILTKTPYGSRVSRRSLMTYGAVIENTYSSIDRLYEITIEKAYDGIMEYLPTKRYRI